MKYDFTQFKNEAAKIKEWLGKEYLSLHTGRATPAVLDRVQVESYGTKTSISHVAAISTEDARSLLISPWDKGVIKEIERAIQMANIGLSTSVSESGIRVSFPELTTERRVALVKVVKDKLEDARISVRKERERVWEDIQKKEKEGEMSEDDKFHGKEELQKHVDETNRALEEMAKRKETDVMH